MELNKKDARLRVLTVEDSEHDRIAFRRAFNKSDIPSEITECEKTEEAMRALKNDPSAFDVVVSDNGLPGMTGLDFFKQLLARGPSPIPLVLLTGSGTEEIAIEALKAGVHDYIIKDEYSRYLELLPVTLMGVVRRHREKSRRILAEQYLQAERSKLKGILEAMRDGVYIVNKQCDIEYVNPVAKKAFGPIKGRKCHEYFHSLQDPCPSCSNEEVFTHGKSVTWECYSPKNNRSFELFATPIKNADGSISKLEMFHDITHRRKGEEELKKAKEKAEGATRLKDKFVSLVAHDLKGPLGTMISALNFLRLDCAGAITEKHGLIMDSAIGSGERMLRLIDELLSVSRFKTGQLNPKPIFLDAHYLARKILSDFSSPAAKKGINIENEVPERTRIFADEILLHEVLQNFVSNAIKFCNTGDKITILLQDGEGDTIAVADTGIGIKPEKHKRIFQYEERTTTRGTMGETGTGLGLPLCRDIMEGHEGSVHLESILGKGSVFSARLPHLTPRLLIVEDSKIVRSLIKEMLEGENMEILEAENGQEAITAMEKGLPHLIIADIMMPVMDGFDLLRLIRGQKKTESIPVIIATSDTNIDTREKAFRMGANDFVTKPLAPEDLLPRVRRIIP